MKTKTIRKYPLAAALMAAFLLQTNNAGATWTIHDDLVVEGDTTIEGELKVYDSAVISAIWSASSAGSYALSVGLDSFALGSMSIGSGDFVSASNSAAAAFGTATVASGWSSLAGGYYSLATGDHSTALGYDLRAESYASFAVGRYNVGGSDPLGGDTSWFSGDPLFEVGIGDSNSNRANAMTVYKNGNTEFAGTVRIQPSGDIGMGQFTSEP